MVWGLVSPKKVKSDSPKKRQRSTSPRKGRVVMSERLAVMTKDADIDKENPFMIDKEAIVDKSEVVLQSTVNVDVVPRGDPAKTDVIEIDKHKADVVKSSNVVTNKNVVADKVDVAKDVVQDDPAKVVKESVAKDKPKGRKESSEKEEKKLNVVSKDKPKSKASELVKRKRKGGPDSDSNFVDEKEHSKKKPDRKQKKLKAGLKRKTSGSDASDSSSIDSEVVKQLTSQLIKKVKREESDKESMQKKGLKKLMKNVKKEESHDESKKGKNKEKQLTAEEAAYQEYLSKFPAFHARTTPVTHSKIHDMLGIPVGGHSLFNLVERETGDEFVKKWAAQFSPKELKQIRVNDIARILVGSKEIDFLFKVNFLTLFTNTMCKADGLKGEICLDVVKRLREDTVISQIDWCGYVYDCLRDSKLPNGTNNYLGPLTFLINKAKMEEAEGFIVSVENSEKESHEILFESHEIQSHESHEILSDLMRFTMNLIRGESHEILKLSLICAERVMLEEYMRKARLENPGDGKFIGLHEKYFNLFKDPISFEDDGNGNNVGDDDDGNGDDGDDDANDGEGNVDENDANECDKNPNGNNQSFGFNKISLDDFDNDSGPTESEPVDPTKQGTVVDVNTVEEGENTVENCGIMSSPEEFTQWLNKNVNLVGEACDSIVTEYLHGDKLLTKTTTMTILDNSPGTYDSKYKDVCDLLSESNEIQNESHEIHSESHKIHSESHKIQSESHEIRKDLMRLIFESHVARVKHTIPKVKWKTKENFYDCGIFTMLHMENFNGGPASDFDCGLPVESQLQLDILRRLRFKFATKILLHEINLQSEKMVEFAKEFDKKGPSEKISIIIDAIKNREERDRIDN
ncbi:hypothetical protein Tco_0503479 [Tanacetum coccineum]